MKKNWLKEGTLLDGRYLIEGVLGEGGFGITYKCKHQSIGMTVAIKEYFSKEYMERNTDESNDVIVTENESYEKEKTKFLKEAKTLCGFSKKQGVVHITDFFEENNTAYIVMEYIEGKSLKNEIKEGTPIAPQIAMKKMLPVIKTLNEIHKSGVIHRDIGPNNIMVQPDGNFRLIDFGSAKDYENIDEKTYSIILTGGYAPPEQYNKEGKQGPWTDVYSICATIYFCVVGKSPREALARILYDDIETPTDKGVIIDPALEKIVMKGLSIEPKDRYQSMEELSEAIEEIIEPDNSDEQKNRTKPKKKKTKLLIAIAAIVLLIGIGAFGGIKYYNSHLEQIKFGNKETVHFILEADEEMSAKEYMNDKDIVEKRLKLLTDNKYIMEEQDDKLYITIPKDCYGNEKLYKKDEDIQDLIKSFISRPCVSYVTSEKTKEGTEWHAEDLKDNSIKLTPESIKNISIKKGSIKGFDTSKSKYITKDNYTYLEIYLNDDVTKKILDGKITDDIFVYQDVEGDYLNYYCFFGKLSTDRKILYAVLDVKGDNFANLYKYNVMHNSFKDSFAISGYDIPIKWEDIEKVENKGKYQVNETDIEGDNITFEYTYYESDYDKYTDGQYKSVLLDYKKRLDILKVPYAIGSALKNDKYIEIKMSKKDANTDFMTSVLPKKYGAFSIRNSTYDYENIEYSKNILVDIKKENGSYKLIYKDKYEFNFKKIEEFSNNIIKSKDNTIYFTMGDYNIASGKITKTIKNGEIIFDKYLQKQDDYPMYLYYFKKAFLETTMEEEYTNRNVIYRDSNNKLLSMNNQKNQNPFIDNCDYIEKDEKIIKEINPEIKTEISKRQLLCWYPNDDYNTSQIINIIGQMKKIYDQCGCKNNKYDKISFYYKTRRDYGNSYVCLDKDLSNGITEIYFGNNITVNRDKINEKLIIKTIKKSFPNIKFRK